MEPVDLVRAYVETSQRARASQEPTDFERLRELVADEVEILLASPWSGEPWRRAHSGPDQMIARLRDGANAASILRTETVNLVAAGEDVLVEQRSTITLDGTAYVSMVCHLFTVADGRIQQIRTYRNDAGLPV